MSENLDFSLPEHDRPRPSRSGRCGAALQWLTLGVVLVLAAWLQPSPLGHSTDAQLGLGQCSFLTLTGYPCPMCGATTTFTLWAHLQPLTGLATQPFASLLFLMTVGTFAVALAEIVQPRERWRRILEALGPYEGVLATLFLVAMGLGWIYKIAIMRWLV